ncbi:hypothetical protein FM120_10895 [Sphingobacterium faecium PCAi_F2.5]|nr:hypothetical protein FM120_10895 [Sphingobacterium faecium PCAi_F2.5]
MLSLDLLDFIYSQELSVLFYMNIFEFNDPNPFQFLIV